MAKLEKQYKADGCEVTLARLRQNLELLAPPEMHAQIKDNLAALAQIDEVTFDVVSSSFAVLITNDPSRLLDLVKSKCFLEKSIRAQRINIPMPRASVPDFEDSAAQPAKATPPSSNKASINVGQSTITVAIGDLAKQAVSSTMLSPCRIDREPSLLRMIVVVQVDIIVVSSTSEILRNAIIAAAGPQTKTDWEAAKAHIGKGFATSNGNLPCEAILFLPFVADQSNTGSLQKSLHGFIVTAIQYASQKNVTSIGEFVVSFLLHTVGFSWSSIHISSLSQRWLWQTQFWSFADRQVDDWRNARCFD